MGRDVPFGQLEVGPADGAGADTDEELAGARDRIGDPGQSERAGGGRRGAVEEERLHAWTLRRAAQVEPFARGEDRDPHARGELTGGHRELTARSYEPVRPDLAHGLRPEGPPVDRHRDARVG